MSLPSRLEACRTIGDLRSLARRRVPRAVFDYVDGGAEAEIGLRRARRTFRDMEFQPSVLRDVQDVDLGVTVLGRHSPSPFAFAPTGFTRMMHSAGERAVAGVAAQRGIPYALSTMGTTSIEDTAAASAGGRLWFQLYVWRDRAAAADLIARASESGYEALLLTVDVPVAGARLRDVRNGLTVPPTLTPSTLIDMSLHPSWWLNLLTGEPLQFASLSRWEGTVASLLDSLFDPSMTIDDLEWIRSMWRGPLVVKGVQTIEDVRRVVDAGADAVLLSSHGGRQLDRVGAPVRLVPEAVAEVGGRAEVWVDSGITTGGDVVACLALGATTALVGRAYLYGLMAGGAAGVDRAAQILTDEITRTLRLLGVSRVADLNPGQVRLP
jgi:L-lactate dehydrogenase (cytochrome)